MPIKLFYLLCFVGICTTKIIAQTETYDRYSIGINYALFADPGIKDDLGIPYTLWEHYISLQCHYHFKKQWRLGAEYVHTIIEGKHIDNPFYILGMMIDYDVLKSNKLALYFRGGLNGSNLSFPGKIEPIKHTIINRVFGGSLEFKIYRSIQFCTGYYSYTPFNKHQSKFGVIQPFIGFNMSW